MLISFVFIVVALLMCTGFVLFNLLNPLKKVEKTINDIASGNANLTKRISVSSNNEIGAIVVGFNNFTEKLQSIVTELKKSQELFQMQVIFFPRLLRILPMQLKTSRAAFRILHPAFRIRQKALMKLLMP